MYNKNEFTLEEKFTLKNDFPIPSLDDWKLLVGAELKGADFQKKMHTKTYEGIELKPIYTKNDLTDNVIKNSYPGTSNFLRGIRASGYHSKPWNIAIEASADSPEELNSILVNDLNKGANSINIVAGSSTSSVENLEAIFKNIDIGKYPILIHAGVSNLKTVNALKLYCDKYKTNKKNLNCGLLADPISYLSLNGKLEEPIEKIFEDISSATEWLNENLSHAKSLLVNGFTFQNSGSTAVQELAIILSIAVEYFNRLSNNLISIDEIAKSMLVQVGVGSNYFVEISKLRAIKILWKNLLSAYNINEENQKIFIHAKTSMNNQTLCDAHVNLLRTTTEAFSAIVGGIDSLHTNPFDELFEKQNDFSRRLARNTQIILKEESHLDEVTDPAGGSFFVETLTKQIAEAAWIEFQNIQKLGGIIEALKSGYIQSEIEKVTSAKLKDVRTRKAIIVGTNMYANPKENNVSDKKSINKNIDDQNSSMKILKQFRPASIFEELRIKSEKYLSQFGNKPKVFLMNMGSLKQFKARADFSRAFFEIGGFEVLYTNGFNSSEEAANAFNSSAAKIFIICSTDETYPELVPSIIKKVSKSAIKILAGYPNEQIETHKENGINEFIYLGCDAYSVLNAIYKKLSNEIF